MIYSGGALGFGAPADTFNNMSALAFKARANDGGTPYLSINMVTDQVT